MTYITLGCSNTKNELQRKKSLQKISMTESNVKGGKDKVDNVIERNYLAEFIF